MDFCANRINIESSLRQGEINFSAVQCLAALAPDLTQKRYGKKKKLYIGKQLSLQFIILYYVEHE